MEGEFKALNKGKLLEESTKLTSFLEDKEEMKAISYVKALIS